MTSTNVGLSDAVRTGRSAINWSWYISLRRGGNGIGHRAYNQENAKFGEYPGWKVMYSQPHQRFGIAGGRTGRRGCKIHLVRDQIVAKHAHHHEARLTRWLCGAYTFEGILQAEAAVVCSACLAKAQHRTTEPLPKEKT